MEKGVNDEMKMLTIDEIRDDLKLPFKRLNMKANEKNESDFVEELSLFGVQFKGKCRNCGDIGHNAQDCKI
jgi:hypothetical protein